MFVANLFHQEDHMKPSILLATAVLLVINSTARAQGEDLFQACLIETMSKADSSTTVGELRKTCEEEVKVKKRMVKAQS